MEMLCWLCMCPAGGKGCKNREDQCISIQPTAQSHIQRSCRSITAEGQEHTEQCMLQSTRWLLDKQWAKSVRSGCLFFCFPYLWMFCVRCGTRLIGRFLSSFSILFPLVIIVMCPVIDVSPLLSVQWLVVRLLANSDLLAFWDCFGHGSKICVTCFLRYHLVLRRVLVMDEIDQLVTADSAILYQIFEWALLPKSRLVLLAIANTLSFTSTDLKRLELKGCKLLHVHVRTLVCSCVGAQSCCAATVHVIVFLLLSWRWCMFVNSSHISDFFQ